jgi:hypothetical protein
MSFESLSPTTCELLENFDQTAYELGVWPHLDQPQKRYHTAKDLLIAHLLALETELNILRLAVEKTSFLAG